jgi:hypothetical protein
MATSTLAPVKHKGGSFLLESTAPEEVFTPEDFTEEHHAIARTTDDFWNKLRIWKRFSIRSPDSPFPFCGNQDNWV